MPKRASRFIARVAAATLLLTSVPVDNAIADQDLQDAGLVYKYLCDTWKEMIVRRDHYKNEAVKFAELMNSLSFEDTCRDFTRENRYCQGIYNKHRQAHFEYLSMAQQIPAVGDLCAESRRVYHAALSKHLWEIVLTGALPEPGTASPPEAVEPPGPAPARHPLAPAQPAPAEPQPGAGVAALPSPPQQSRNAGPNWSGQWLLTSTNPKITHGDGRLYPVKQKFEIVNQESGTFVVGGRGRPSRAILEGNTISFQSTALNGNQIRVSLTMTRDACRGTLISRSRDGKLLHWKTTCRRY